MLKTLKYRDPDLKYGDSRTLGLDSQDYKTTVVIICYHYRKEMDSDMALQI